MKNNYNFPNKKITRGVASSPVVATSVASGIRAAHGCPHTQCAASRTVWPMRRVHAAAGVSGKGASHLSAAVTAALTLQTPWRGVGTPGMPRLHGEPLPGSSQSPAAERALPSASSRRQGAGNWRPCWAGSGDRLPPACCPHGHGACTERVSMLRTGRSRGDPWAVKTQL